MRHRLVSFAVSALIATVLTAVWTASALSSQTRHQQSNGTLRGELELCGGPNVGGRHCRIVTGKWTGCTDHVCRSLDEIVVRTPSDKTVAEAGVRRGRFAVRLEPGRYLVLLLWTSTHHRPSVALKRRVAVRADRTTMFLFKGYAG